MTTLNEIKIYVADLAAYNNAILHGVWIDATQELEDIQEKISDMLKTSPIDNAEEYAIHDYDGFGSYRLSEYESLEDVQKIAVFIEEHNDLGMELLAYFDTIEEAETALEDNYHGCFSSLADYAEQFTNETSEVPSHLQYYIDYERMARDWEMSGDIYSIETAYDEIHVFRSH